jgi:hypothetical protein
MAGWTLIEASDWPLRTTEWLIAWAALLQSIELLQLRASFADSGGVWSWRVLRREFTGLPRWARGVLDALLCERGLVWILALRALCAIALVAWPRPWEAATLFATTLLISMRWRGTFNGGSDYMTLIVCAATWVGRTWIDQPRVVAGALAYVALQACLSFWVAGWVKLKQPEWRDGRAIAGFMGSRYYGVPSAFASWARMHPGWLRLSAWGIILFECVFPLALARRDLAMAMIAGAAAFQLANAYALGLNRFVWAWAAAYPAVYWLSGWSWTAAR